MKSILSSRYARSIFDLAVEMNILDKVSEDIFLVEKVCYENSILNVILGNPNINIGKKKAIIRDIFESKVQEITIKFILLLIDKRRVLYLKGIANEFHTIYNQYHNIKLADVYVSQTMTEEIKQEITKILVKKFDSKIELNEILKKEIIGGFKIIVDGVIYDASIANQLKLLRKSFEKNIYDKGF